MLVYLFNSLPIGEYSNPYVVVAFSNNPFSGKIYLSIKNLYLLTIHNDDWEYKANLGCDSYQLNRHNFSSLFKI